jgi:hypothetical protein
MWCALFAAACGHDSTSPTAPKPPVLDVSGSWSGHTVPNVAAFGNGAIVVTLAQGGSALSGTWGVAYPDPANNNSGTLEGEVANNSIAATLSPSNPLACPNKITGIYANNTITGTFATVNCLVSLAGSFSITRQ